MLSQSRNPHIRTFLHTSGILLFSALAALAVTLTQTARAQNVSPPNVILHPAYEMRAFATGLDFPTAIAISGSRVWVCEAGILDPSLPPTIKEINPDGTTRVVLTSAMLPNGRFAGPLTALKFRDGLLWVAHRYVGVNGWMLGAISKFNPDNPVATFVNVVTGLPSAGDHYTEDIEFDSTGRLYFSQGTASNSGVIGPDNEMITRWLSMAPTFHDYPPTRVALTGVAFRTPVPFALDPGTVAVTLPFHKFNSGPAPTDKLLILEAPSPIVEQDGGIIAGNGAVYSLDPNATNPAITLQLEAWGLRNPYGIGFDPVVPTRLFISNNGADTRISPVDGQLRVIEARPIENDWDDLFTLNIGEREKFYGWPDYFHDPVTGMPLPVTAAIFAQQEHGVAFPAPDFILHQATRENLPVEPAYAQFEEHSSANKFAFSTDSDFRFVGDLFVAETGSFVPVSGAESFTGYKVVRVDRVTRAVFDFIRHRANTVEDLFMPDGFNKPIDVKFRGGTMLVVDFGVFEPGLGLQSPKTGKIWRVEVSAAGASGVGFNNGRIITRPGLIQGPVILLPPPEPETDATPGADPRRSSVGPSSVIRSKPAR